MLPRQIQSGSQREEEGVEEADLPASRLLLLLLPRDLFAPSCWDRDALGVVSDSSTTVTLRDDLIAASVWQKQTTYLIFAELNNKHQTK